MGNSLTRIIASASQRSPRRASVSIAVVRAPAMVKATPPAISTALMIGDTRSL